MRCIRMENHFPFNPRGLFSLLNVLTQPTESPELKQSRISWVIAPALFPEAWQQAKTSGFGIFPIFLSNMLKAKTIIRVWSSKWSLPNCYCFLMLWGRFIYGSTEICFWLSSLSIDMVQSDINPKMLAVCAVFLLILGPNCYAGVWL